MCVREMFFYTVRYRPRLFFIHRVFYLPCFLFTAFFFMKTIHFPSFYHAISTCQAVVLRDRRVPKVVFIRNKAPIA